MAGVPIASAFRVWRERGTKSNNAFSLGFVSLGYSPGIGRAEMGSEIEAELAAVVDGTAGSLGGLPVVQGRLWPLLAEPGLDPAAALVGVSLAAAIHLRLPGRGGRDARRWLVGAAHVGADDTRSRRRR